MMVCASENEMKDLIFEMLLNWKIADLVIFEKCLLKLRSQSRVTPRFLASVEHLKPLASRRVETVGLCLFGESTT